MSPGQKLLAGFAVGGIAMLLAHPASRNLLLYGPWSGTVDEVRGDHPFFDRPVQLSFSKEPSEMTSLELSLAARRISQRLLESNPVAAPSDLRSAMTFASQAGSADPDNSLWPQMEAVILAKMDSKEQAVSQWHAATTRARWDSGTGNVFSELWEKFALAESRRLSWQGMYALSFRPGGPANLIGTAREPFYSEIQERYVSLINSRLILYGARSFRESAEGISIGNRAVFGTPSLDGIPARQIQQRTTTFLNEVADAFGESARTRASHALNALESWRNFTQPLAEDARKAKARMAVYSVLTASLPFSLFVSTIIMAVGALGGALMSTFFRERPHFDARLIYLLAAVAAVAAFLYTGVILVAVWFVVIAILIAAPMHLLKDGPLEFSSMERFWPALLGGIALAAFAAWLVFAAPPASHLLDMVSARSFLAIGIVSLTFALPLGVVFARSKAKAALYCAGETLRSTAAFGMAVGALATIIATPLSVYLERDHQETISNWIRNEPESFRQ